MNIEYRILKIEYQISDIDDEFGSVFCNVFVSTALTGLGQGSFKRIKVKSFSDTWGKK